jgi:hypothetical protein
MTEIQDQYTEFAKQGQEAAYGVVEAWSKSVQEAASQLPSLITQAGAHKVVDQIFDFTAAVIDVQRSLVKQFITSSTTVAEDLKQNLTEHTSA